MRRAREAVLSILSVTLFVTVSSTSATGATLEECFQAALRRSESLAIQGERVFQAKELERQATGSILPSLDATASYLWQDRPRSGIGQTIFPRTQPLLKFTAVQPLFRGLREFAALRRTRALSEAEHFEYQNAVTALYSRLAEGFYRVLSFESEIRNMTSEADLAEKRAKELRDRRRIGRSRPSEVMSVETTLASLRSEIELVRANLATERELLSFLTGLPESVPLNEPADHVSDRLPPLPEYLARIPERPDIRTQQARERAADENVAIARGGHLPSVDMTGNYYLKRSGSLEDVKWDIQVELRMPLYAGGIIESQVREAASQLMQAELGAGETLRRATQEVRTFHAQVTSSKTALASLLEAEALANRNYVEQSREYRLGLVTNIEVLEALTELAAIRRNLDKTRIELKLARDRLEAAVSLRPK